MGAGEVPPAAGVGRLIVPVGFVVLTKQVSTAPSADVASSLSST